MFVKHKRYLNSRSIEDESRTYCFGESGGEGEGVIMFEEVVNMLGGEEDMVNMLEEVVNVLAEADVLPGSAILGNSLSCNL